MVVVPGTEGNFGVLPGHAPLISSIRPGTIDVYEGQTVTRRIFVVSGIAEVTPERCTVLADEALPPDELDRGTIEAELQTVAGQSSKPARAGCTCDRRRTRHPARRTPPPRTPAECPPGRVAGARRNRPLDSFRLYRRRRRRSLFKWAMPRAAVPGSAHIGFRMLRWRRLRGRRACAQASRREGCLGWVATCSGPSFSGRSRVSALQQVRCGGDARCHRRPQLEQLLQCGDNRGMVEREGRLIRAAFGEAGLCCRARYRARSARQARARHSGRTRTRRGRGRPAVPREEAARGRNSRHARHKRRSTGYARQVGALRTAL